MVVSTQYSIVKHPKIVKLDMHLQTDEYFFNIRDRLSAFNDCIMIKVFIILPVHVKFALVEYA